MEAVQEDCSLTYTLWWPVSKNMNVLCNFGWSATASQHDAAFSKHYI